MARLARCRQAHRCGHYHRRQRVSGSDHGGWFLTSAIGLTFGGGFYEGGILATVFIMLAELVFSRIEYRVLENVPEINLYMEYETSTVWMMCFSSTAAAILKC